MRPRIQSGQWDPGSKYCSAAAEGPGLGAVTVEEKQFSGVSKETIFFPSD